MSRFETFKRSCVDFTSLYFNLVFMLTGIVILFIGALRLTEYHKFQSFMDGHFLSLPAFFIVISVLIFVVAFSGTYGRPNVNYYVVIMFDMLMVAIFVMELIAGTSGFILTTHAEELTKSTMLVSLNDYDVIIRTTVLWDDFQMTYGCCGVDGPTDWIEQTNSTHNSLPSTCCDLSDTDLNTICTMTTSTLWKDGCSARVITVAEQFALTLGTSGVIFALLQIIGMFTAYQLAKRSGNQYNPMS